MHVTIFRTMAVHNAYLNACFHNDARDLDRRKIVGKTWPVAPHQNEGRETFQRAVHFAGLKR